jgi:DNA gyrase/topoisomerase IV subunit A|tara:strand:+ start:180 stop:1049 length:870 start_codon:yes stop_codon:yes gene_type:complete
MGFLENFSTLGGNFKEGTGWAAAAQIAPAALGSFQAIKANRNYKETMQKIEDYQRQDIVNPYQNLSNPYQNLAVATEGARFQAEQADIALANTLDNLRQTGSGGATALAQAALQSKKGVSASIEQQEVQNQKLQAAGQLQVDLAKAKGEAFAFGVRERREQQDLDRLQRQADIARAQQIASTSGAISALGAGLGALGSGILPPEISLETQNDVNVFEDAGVNINDIFGAQAQNKANQQQIAQNIGLNLAGIAAGSGGLNAGANVLPNQSNIPASKPVTLTQISNALMNM